MFSQETSDVQSTFVLVSDAEGHSLQAAMQQVGCVRIESASEMIQPMSDFLNPGGLPQHHPADDVRMSVEVLGPAMEGEIEPPLQWAKIDGTREGTINERNQSMRPGELNYRLQIGHLQERVGHRFNVDGFGVWFQPSLPGFWALCFDEIVGEPKGWEIASHQVVGPTVKSTLNQQMVP